MINERALVLGATGWIGRHVVQALHRQNMAVRALCRWDSDTSIWKTWSPEIAIGDMLDIASLESAMAGCNYVVFCARPRWASDPDLYRRNWVLGLRHVFDLMRDTDVERILLTSCVSVLDPPQGKPIGAHHSPSLPAQRSTAPSMRSNACALPGTSGDPHVEALYAIDNEFQRFAADLLDAMTLYLPLCIPPSLKTSSSGTHQEALWAQGGPAEDPSLKQEDAPPKAGSWLSDDLVHLLPSGLKSTLKKLSSKSESVHQALGNQRAFRDHFRLSVCDVEDAAQAHLTILKKGQPGQRYRLGGKPTSVGQWRQSLSSKPRVLEHLPMQQRHLFEQNAYFEDVLPPA